MKCSECNKGTLHGPRTWIQEDHWDRVRVVRVEVESYDCDQCAGYELTYRAMGVLQDLIKATPDPTIGVYRWRDHKWNHDDN